MRRVESRAHAAALGLALGALLAPAPAPAACTVSTTGVAFGAYNPQSASAIDSTGTVNVTCTIIDPAPEVELGTGNSGTFSPRRMSNGISNLSYNLYTAPTRTVVWGDGTGATQSVTLSGGTVVLFFWRSYSRTIYGRIPGSQNVTAGTYNDTVIVTVNF